MTYKSKAAEMARFPSAPCKSCFVGPSHRNSALRLPVSTSKPAVFLDPDNRRKACPVSVKARLRRDKHVREDKKKVDLSGTRRGKEAAALDAAGARLGSFGLAAFAVVTWRDGGCARSGAHACNGRLDLRVASSHAPWIRHSWLMASFLFR
jgi:hypothetical protein